MAKNKKTKDKKPAEAVTDADDALARARTASAQLKPKNEALYWAITAQNLLLSDIRDMMREERTDAGETEAPEQDGARSRTSSTAKPAAAKSGSTSSSTPSSSGRSRGSGGSKTETTSQSGTRTRTSASSKTGTAAKTGSRTGSGSGNPSGSSGSGANSRNR